MIRSKCAAYMHVKRFLASIRFDNKGKLDKLGFGIEKNTLSFEDQWFESAKGSFQF